MTIIFGGGKKMKYSITLIGSSGSGKSTLQQGLKNFSSRFAVFPKITTREKRSYEINGQDYYFINDKRFDESIARNELIHLKFSDFDFTRYGVKKADLHTFLEKGKVPIFTSHSLEEAQCLSYCLKPINVFNLCIYIFTNEQNRKTYLYNKNESKKYFYRYYMDIAFKIQAFLKSYQDCHYFIYNNQNKQDLLLHCEAIEKLANKEKIENLVLNSEILSEIKIEIDALINKINNEYDKNR